MTAVAGTVERGRDAFARRAWSEAHAPLLAGEPLPVEDVERLAIAAYLLGRDGESAEALERAPRASPAGGARRRGPLALWLGVLLLLRGEMARASGWQARAERLVEQVGRECPATGLVLMPGFLQALMGGDPATAHSPTAWPTSVSGSQSPIWWRWDCWPRVRPRSPSGRRSGP